MDSLFGKFHVPDNSFNAKDQWDKGLSKRRAPRDLGTSAYIDPTEGMIGILFTQRMIDSPEPPKG